MLMMKAMVIYLGDVVITVIGTMIMVVVTMVLNFSCDYGAEFFSHCEFQKRSTA